MMVVDQQLESYWLLVREYSKSMNLTAWQTREEWWNYGIHPAMKYVAKIAMGESVVDVGSGQGLPGIVIAIHRPNNRVVLVEPRQRRAAFLRLVAKKLCLNVEVMAKRAEDVRGQFDVVTARAVANAEKLYRMTEHLGHDASKWVLKMPEKSGAYFVNNRISYIDYE